MSLLDIIFTSILAGGAASTIIAYFSKTLITQLLAKDLENYKSRLMADLESLKSDLNKGLHAFSTQFSRVDQQRTTGIMEIHGLMCQIEQMVIWESGAASTAIISTSPEERTAKALNRAWEDIAKLNQVLSYHSLLLDEKIEIEILDWSKIMMGLISSIGNEIEPLRKRAVGSDGQLEGREAVIASIRNKHMDKYISRLGELRKGLETEFKKILGLIPS
jgi:hypothetical protein